MRSRVRDRRALGVIHTLALASLSKLVEVRGRGPGCSSSETVPGDGFSPGGFGRGLRLARETGRGCPQRGERLVLLLGRPEAPSPQPPPPDGAQLFQPREKNVISFVRGLAGDGSG